MKRIFKKSDELPDELDKLFGEAASEFNPKQDMLDEKYGFSDYLGWSFDKKTGILELIKTDDEKLAYEAQVLGTFCSIDKTFEWSWHSPHFDSDLCRDSLLVKELGERFDVPYLKEGMIPTPEHKYLMYIASIGLKVSNALGVFHQSNGEVELVLLVKNIVK